MSNIKKIIKGLVYAQANEGQQIPQMALTKSATAVVEGQTLTNQLYLAAGRGPWNKKNGYLPGANPAGTGAGYRINGVVSGCAVTPNSANDKIDIAAGVVNVNGVRVVYAGSTATSVTRPAAAHYSVSAVCIDAAGSVSLVKGTDGDSLDLTGGYDGAGQMPLVATTLAVLAYVVTYDNAAALITTADIYDGESANMDPIVDALRGGLIMRAALPLNHTGGVSRGVYASFYDLTTALVALAKLEDATLTVKRAAPIATPNHDTNYGSYVTMPTMDWSVNVKKWRVDQAWVDKYLDPNQDEFYLKLVEDYQDAYAFYGYGILTGDLVISTKRGPVSESLNFQGNGELRRA